MAYIIAVARNPLMHRHLHRQSSVAARQTQQGGHFSLSHLLWLAHLVLSDLAQSDEILEISS
jgi:hypothetical protein